jgi:hypothetical protein
MRCLLALPLFVILAPTAQAHGGGVDAAGCHTNRKTGVRHCHGGAHQPQTRNAARGTGSRDMFLADSTYFPNCDAARSAGAAPMRRGEPGYRAQLDRDDDGIACEPSRFTE